MFLLGGGKAATHKFNRSKIRHWKNRIEICSMDWEGPETTLCVWTALGCEEGWFKVPSGVSANYTPLHIQVCNLGHVTQRPSAFVPYLYIETNNDLPYLTILQRE